MILKRISVEIDPRPKLSPVRSVLGSDWSRHQSCKECLDTSLGLYLKKTIQSTRKWLNFRVGKIFIRPTTRLCLINIIVYIRSGHPDHVLHHVGGSEEHLQLQQGPQEGHQSSLLQHPPLPPYTHVGTRRCGDILRPRASEGREPEVFSSTNCDWVFLFFTIRLWLCSGGRLCCRYRLQGKDQAEET